MVIKESTSSAPTPFLRWKLGLQETVSGWRREDAQSQQQLEKTTLQHVGPSTGAKFALFMSLRKKTASSSIAAICVYTYNIYIYGKFVYIYIYMCVCVYVCTSKQFTVSIYIFIKTPIPLVHSNHLLNIYILYNVPSYNGYVTIYGLYIQITILSKDVILYIANRYPDIRITIIHYLVGGIPTLPLWKMMASVSWDDIPKWMESHKIPWFQTTNQRLLVYKTLWSPLINYSHIYHKP